LLKAGLFGAGAVALGSVLLATRSSRLRKPKAGLKLLSAQQYAVLSAAAARLIPGSQHAPSADRLGVVETIDALLADKEQDVQQGLKISLTLLENALSGALFDTRFTPFTQLSGEEQDQALRAFRDSRLTFRRSIFAALDALVSAVYFGDARAWQAVGYPGPPDPAKLRAMYADNLVDLRALAAPAKDAK
jgi:hypothetical protein